MGEAAKREKEKQLEGTARIAHQMLRQAETHYHKSLVAAFPAGRRITYQRGKDRVRCQVLEHSLDRLKVEGVTGKQYWIDGYRVLF